MKFENDTLRRRRTLGQKFGKKCKKQSLKGYKECLVDSKNSSPKGSALCCFRSRVKSANLISGAVTSFECDLMKFEPNQLSLSSS